MPPRQWAHACLGFRPQACRHAPLDMNSDDCPTLLVCCGGTRQDKGGPVTCWRGAYALPEEDDCLAEPLLPPLRAGPERMHPGPPAPQRAMNSAGNATNLHTFGDFGDMCPDWLEAVRDPAPVTRPASLAREIMWKRHSDPDAGPSWTPGDRPYSEGHASVTIMTPMSVDTAVASPASCRPVSARSTALTSGTQQACRLRSPDTVALLTPVSVDTVKSTMCCKAVLSGEASSVDLLTPVSMATVKPKGDGPDTSSARRGYTYERLDATEVETPGSVVADVCIGAPRPLEISERRSASHLKEDMLARLSEEMLGRRRLFS